MIRSVLTLRPGADRADAVVDLYRDRQVLRFSLDHSRAVASEISVAVDGSGDLVITALWPDPGAYQEWLDHPDRNIPALEALLDGVAGSARLYRVAHEVRADGR